MLDQSFSAHNFETIYGFESRKGCLDIHSMPQSYHDIVAETNRLKELIKDLKKSDDENAAEIIQLRKTELNASIEAGKQELSRYLSELANEVNSPQFKFGLKSFLLKDKEVFNIDTTSHSQFFAIKQLQYNLRKTFKVCQANRHHILSNIKIFLNSKIPVYVIRTDISGFYESIPQDKLLKKVIDDSLLNYKSKSFIKGILSEYDNLKDKNKIQEGYGVPRGIGISAYLSEIYMRELDKEISTRREVIYYARYVDDIFIILSSLPQGKDLGQYYKEIQKRFEDFNLTLKSPSEDKCELISLYNSPINHQETVTYLGYKLIIKEQTGESGNSITVQFQMKHDKVDAIKSKIDNAIKHFDALSVVNPKQAYKDLKDALNYITGNMSLNKTKSGVKTGLYYSNDLLDGKCPDLIGLTHYLHSKSVSPYNKLDGYKILQERVNKRIKSIDFVECWKSRKFNRFTIDRIQELDSWL